MANMFDSGTGSRKLHEMMFIIADAMDAVTA